LGFKGSLGGLKIDMGSTINMDTGVMVEPTEGDYGRDPSERPRGGMAGGPGGPGAKGGAVRHVKPVKHAQAGGALKPMATGAKGAAPAGFGAMGAAAARNPYQKLVYEPEQLRGFDGSGYEGKGLLENSHLKMKNMGSILSVGAKTKLFDTMDASEAQTGFKRQNGYNILDIDDGKGNTAILDTNGSH